MARTKTAADAILYYEGGQAYVSTVELTDSDHTIFTSADSLWSGYEGKIPVVRPNGLISGGVITPAASGTNDLVDVSAATAYVAGVEVEVSAATDLEITRATSTDTHMINSIVVSSGSFAAVTGTDHASAFSAVRDAAGGPPLIGVSEVEVGQVRTTSFTAAAVASAEIFQVVGTHQQRYDYPIWVEDWATGKITFAAAQPLIHTAAVARKVYAAYYTPIFSEVQNSSDFVPPENSHSVSSTQIYGGTVGETSSSIGQGSFTTRLQTGVTDTLITNKNKTLWLKFFPDRYRDEYVLCQGKLGITRSFPAGGAILANCTISASEVAIDKES